MSKAKQIPRDQRLNKSYADAKIPVLEGGGKTAVYRTKYGVRAAESGNGFDVVNLHNNTVEASNFPTPAAALEWMRTNTAP